MDFVEWRNLSLTLLEALIFLQDGASIRELLLLIWKLLMNWIDRPTIADYFRLWIRCYVGRIYKPLWITRRSFYLIFIRRPDFWQDAASIWDLWILLGSKRPIADYFCGSDVTPAVHKPLSITRRGFYLIYECRICDPSRFVAAVCVRKVKAPFFTGKPVVSGFSHLLLIPIFLYVFDAQWGQTKLNSLAVFLLPQLGIVNYYVKSSLNNLSNENIKTGVSREMIFQKKFILAS